MKSHRKTPSRAEARAEVKRLKLEIAIAGRKTDTARARAQAAKTGFKEARKVFKKAKKLAKEARKELKALKKALTLMTQVAAKASVSRKAGRSGLKKLAPPRAGSLADAKKSLAKKRTSKKPAVVGPAILPAASHDAPLPTGTPPPTPGPLPADPAVRPTDRNIVTMDDIGGTLPPPSNLE